MSLLDKINFLKNLEQQKITIEQYQAKRLVATFEQEENLRNLLIEIAENERLDGITETYECMFMNEETIMSYTVQNEVIRGNIKRLNKELDFVIYFDKDEDAPHVPYIKCEFSDFVMVDKLVRIFCKELMLSEYHKIDNEKTPNKLSSECPFLNDEFYYEIKHKAEQIGAKVISQKDCLYINFPLSSKDEHIEIYAPDENGYRNMYHVFDGYGDPLGNPDCISDRMILNEVLNIINNKSKQKNVKL